MHYNEYDAFTGWMVYVSCESSKYWSSGNSIARWNVELSLDTWTSREMSVSNINTTLPTI